MFQLLQRISTFSEGVPAAPIWLAAFENRILAAFDNRLTERLAAQTISVGILIKLSNKNSQMRLSNSKKTGDATLLPIYCEDETNVNFNTPPPVNIFPTNIDVVNNWLTLAPFMALEGFYGVEFPGNLPLKRKSFLNFIGVY